MTARLRDRLRVLLLCLSIPTSVIAGAVFGATTYAVVGSFVATRFVIPAFATFLVFPLLAFGASILLAHMADGLRESPLPPATPQPSGPEPRCPHCNDDDLRAFPRAVCGVKFCVCVRCERAFHVRESVWSGQRLLDANVADCGWRAYPLTPDPPHEYLRTVIGLFAALAASVVVLTPIGLYLGSSQLVGLAATFLLLIVGALAYAGAARIVHRPSREGRCETCGFLLVGLEVPRCPECGTSFAHRLVLVRYEPTAVAEPAATGEPDGDGATD